MMVTTPFLALPNKRGFQANKQTKNEEVHNWSKTNSTKPSTYYNLTPPKTLPNLTEVIGLKTSMKMYEMVLASVTHYYSVVILFLQILNILSLMSDTDVW